MAGFFHRLRRILHILNTLEYSAASPKRGSAARSNGIRQVRKRLRGVELDISVAEYSSVTGTGQATKVFQVLARVQPIDTTLGLNDLRVSLVAGQRELASFPLRNNQAVFDDVRPGRYLLRLDHKRAELGSVIFNLV